ncbi:MAG TPA: DUF2550 domain-containing protein [Aeromicrobium sp.]|nr:DUF2550 domain-containing protein [Aeromicrobium sp.]
MPLWIWLLDSLALAIVLSVALVGLLVARRRMVSRRSGTFDLSVCRQPGAQPNGWVIGVGSYGPESLDWYRTFSFAWWPSYRFFRGDLEIFERRDPEGAEAFALDDGDVIVRIKHLSGVQQLAMSPSALTGLLAWLESSPPGRGVSNVV